MQQVVTAIALSIQLRPKVRAEDVRIGPSDSFPFGFEAAAHRMRIESDIKVRCGKQLAALAHVPGFSAGSKDRDAMAALGESLDQHVEPAGRRSPERKRRFGKPDQYSKRLHW